MFATAMTTAWARRSMSIGVLLAIALGTALAGSTGLLLTVPALTELVPLFATGSSIAIFISVFVVAGAITFGVDQRGRELALFRAVGASPRQVRRLVVGETMLIALVGVAIGALISYSIVDGTVAYLRYVDWLPPGSTDPAGKSGWVALASAIAIGLLVAWVAAIPSARRASRARPVDALRNTAIPVRVMTVSRTIIGIVALVGGIILLVVVAIAPPSPAIGIAILVPQVLTIALVALGPVLICPVIRLAGMPLRALTRASGTVAMGQVRTGVRRATSTAGTAITLVGIFGTLIAVPQTLLASESASNTEQITAQLVVQGVTTDAADVVVPEGALLVMLPLAEAVVPEVDPDMELSEVDEAINEPVTIVSADMASLQSVVTLTPEGGSFEAITADTVLISTELALELAVTTGDTFPLRFPDGSEAPVTVGAIAHMPTLMGAQVVVDDELSGLLAAQPWVAASGLATVAPGYSVSQASDELAEALPGATVATTADVIAQRDSDAQRTSWIAMMLIAGVATLFSVISIANTQAMGANERRGDVSLLRRTGATPGQVVRVVVWEVSATVFVGVVMGAALALFATLSTFTLVGNFMVAPTLAVPWATFGVLAGVALVVALVAAVVPLARSFWRTQ